MAKKQPDSNVDFAGGAHATVSFDADAFDIAIRSQGVILEHWRAVKCPVGLGDRFDIRHTHKDGSNCSNGFFYIKAGIVTALFTGNSNRMDQQDYGVLDAANVNCTFARTYDDCDEPIDLMPNDRIYLAQEEILVPHRQLVQSHETGRDRLDFLAVKVVSIVDSDGHVHGPDDYDIVNGQIVWKNGGLPYDPEEKKGMVYSIRFQYRPYWYVKHLPHQIRVAQVQTEEGRTITRMPQQAALQREYVFEKVEKDSTDPDDPRTVQGPGDDSFGPR